MTKMIEAGKLLAFIEENHYSAEGTSKGFLSYVDFDDLKDEINSGRLDASPPSEHGDENGPYDCDGPWAEGWEQRAGIAPSPPQEWLPIDSAPRDGTRVRLLCRNGKEDFGHYEDYTNKPYPTSIPGEWSTDFGNGEPVKWMPLPPPPQRG